MRFIQHLAPETTQLLQKVYQKSKHHRVRPRAQCMLLSYQGYTIKELSHIFQVDRITIYNWFDHCLTVESSSKYLIFKDL